MAEKEIREIMKRTYTYEESCDVGYDVEDCIDNIGKWFKGKVVITIEHIIE